MELNKPERFHLAAKSTTNATMTLMAATTMVTTMATTTMMAAAPTGDVRRALGLQSSLMKVLLIKTIHSPQPFLSTNNKKEKMASNAVELL